VASLRLELSARTRSHVIKVVGERAGADLDYFYCLLSAVIVVSTGRTFCLLTVPHQVGHQWSGYRQSVPEVVRDLIVMRSKKRRRRRMESLPTGYRARTSKESQQQQNSWIVMPSTSGQQTR
jgi:hypothetical protein